MKVFHWFIIVGLLLLVQPLYAQQVSERSEIIENYKGQPYYMHFVRQGETVQSLAELYGVTNVEILKANPEIASGLRPDRVIRIPVKSVQKQKAAEQEEEGQVHEVQPKETWYGIARMYKIPVKDLINENPEVDTLRIGMKISIPQTTGKQKVITGNYGEHTVKPKETLYSLSKRYNTTTDELKRLNPFLSDGLKVGQILMVPLSSVGDENDLKIAVTDTSFIEHEVQRKETLYSISKMYGVDQNTIIKSNPSFDGRLRKGDKLRIPKVFKEVKPYTRPDTIIMGRQINQLATGGSPRKPCTEVSNRSNIYNIALLIPLQLELVDSIKVSDPSGLKGVNEYTSFDFIQFYEGALMAADSLTRAGMNVKMHVFDVDYGSDIEKTRKVLFKPEMAGMDLIIGPFFAESFNLVSDFAKKRGIPLINPLSRRSEIVNSNSHVIKMQPSGWAQYNALAKYLASAHGNDNILIVRRNEEENKNIANVLKSVFINDSLNTVRFKEIIYSAGGWNSISSNLSSTRRNIVVVLTSDKALLPALLRDLSDKAESHLISVVGLPEWEEMELDYNHLIKLNTHFFKPWFVDYESEDVKDFVLKFRERFAGEPEIDKYAFLGYDVTLYFLNALYSYGNGFLNCLESIEERGLSNSYRFIRSMNGGFENYGTAVYKYTDFKRERLN